MKLTKEQIKIIEKTADELKVQANNLSYSPPCATIIQFPPSWCYKKEILLLLMKTNIGDKIEKDFAAIDKLQQEYESWRDKDITENNKEEFTLLIDSLKGALYELSDNLHQIAEYANEELITHKPAEKEQNTPSAKIINIENFKGVLGDVHRPENLQVGDNARIQKYSMIKKIGIIGTIAAMLTILHLLGWLELLKAFISKILRYW